jgi:hypothetical protein
MREKLVEKIGCPDQGRVQIEDQPCMAIDGCPGSSKSEDTPTARMRRVAQGSLIGREPLCLDPLDRLLPLLLFDLGCDALGCARS